MLRVAMLLCALALLPAHAEARQPAPRDPSLIADSLELHALARQLTRNAATDSARAAALYEWVGRNIAYDIANYRHRQQAPSTPERVYRERRALCGGFVQLYERMAHEVGLAVEPVTGYAKGFDYEPGKSAGKPNHVWLAAWLNGAWRLIDPTWGAGLVQNGHFVRKFSWDYFMVNAEVLALSHHPTDAKWQLSARPLSRSDFERLPLVPRDLIGIGFTPSAIRNALRLHVRDFPVVGTPTSAVKVVDAPITGTLRRSTPVPLRVQWPSATDVAVVTGGQWIPLARAGDTFHGQASAAAGPLYVVGRASPAHPYQTLLMYRVD